MVLVVTVFGILVHHFAACHIGVPKSLFLLQHPHVVLILVSEYGSLSSLFVLLCNSYFNFIVLE